MDGQVTSLLKEIAEGSRTAADRLIPLVYQDLKRIASRHMRGERNDHTLQATALVNEAYLKLIGSADVDWKDRAHFFAVASQVMRRILVDHAREHRAEKRGAGARKVSLDGCLVYNWHDPDELLAVDEVLDRLAKFDPRAARIVELRFFVGLGHEEIAEVLGLSSKTVKRDWDIARSWLKSELAGAATS